MTQDTGKRDWADEDLLAQVRRTFRAHDWSPENERWWRERADEWDQEAADCSNDVYGDPELVWR